jgi:segregation and condensation protein B
MSRRNGRDKAQKVAAEAGEIAGEAGEIAGEAEGIAGEVTEVTAEAADEQLGDEPLPEADEQAPPLGAVIEGVLFASAEPVSLKRLARLLSSWSRAEVEQAVAELKERLEADERGIRLVEAAGGLQLRSAERLAPWVRRFFAERPPRLSRPVLETLAIVAYRQPVTRGEVEQIRGVNCDAVLGALTTRGLIRIQGRRSSPGRPAEYGTTETFLELFTLRDLGELPPLPDPAALANLIAGSDEGEGEGDVGNRAAKDDADGAAPEDLEPGGDRFAEGGGGADPERSGPGERAGGEGAGDPGGSDPGSDHR